MNGQLGSDMGEQVDSTAATTPAEAGTPSVEPSMEQSEQPVSVTAGTAGIGGSAAPKVVNYEEEAQKLEDKALRFLAKQTHPVIIPSFTSWFDISEVHEIERRSLPDFFDDSSRFKSPKSYKDTRNFMINTYRLSPYEYLTITAARRNIAMDIASIVKIHSFLEKWGLINYQIDPRSKPSLIGPSFTGHFQVILDTPQGLKPFIPNDSIRVDSTEQDTTQLEPGVKSESKVFPINLSLRKSLYDSTNDFNALQSQNKKNSRQIQKTFVCHTCGNDTMYVRYHNLRARDANVCSKCFQEGHFGANFQASDFIRLENSNLSNKKQWSDQELLLLLEGIEMYEDQWEKIVEHVGTNKSLEDCVEKFLTLPIEDKYINDIVKSEDKSIVKKESGIDSLKTSISPVKAVEMTIQALLNGSHECVLKDSIPESAKSSAAKYILQTQSIAQELVKLTIEKLDSKLEKLNKLEESLEIEKIKYVTESEKLLTDRISMNKQITEINNELSGLNISKKIILASEQVDSGIKLVEKDSMNEEDGNTELKQIKTDLAMDAISVKEPQVYKHWSL
ncbi:hypothetical protein KAFR_0L00670 [Kazachstania africana CBS 2517]|uniref:SWIRM domain-containing protein n=1 Tax=Kazachstania africana (strain ATCC 22294 / BCRC 22015 / CBS 2517 / CECT 1963 / NBRC 1671 / NRRL Y-8276) TaxID=1071382 RepID=H2B224_KAZAF|nr:hypothetical protein KAFR_0L00670 [Kazachstania africana CBS 2517]CCF60674.1 hypothetical protein KAFR_0L00670 [Kazachstania africana CBS 2517]